MIGMVFLAATIAVLPVLGLAAMAWFAIMNEAAMVHSFEGFDGMHFEQ